MTQPEIGGEALLREGEVPSVKLVEKVHQGDKQHQPYCHLRGDAAITYRSVPGHRVGLPCLLPGCLGITESNYVSIFYCLRKRL